MLGYARVLNRRKQVHMNEQADGGKSVQVIV